jgi:hypothetical protein
MYGPIRTETTAQSLLYVPKRYFMHGKKTFFPLHLRKKIKKWNSNFTFINVPCKFQKDRPKKVAMGINGLKVVPATRKSAFFAASLFYRPRDASPPTPTLIVTASVSEIVRETVASLLHVQPAPKRSRMQVRSRRARTALHRHRLLPKPAPR